MKLPEEVKVLGANDVGIEPLLEAIVRDCAKVPELMTLPGGRAWTAEQALCFKTLMGAHNNILARYELESTKMTVPQSTPDPFQAKQFSSKKEAEDYAEGYELSDQLYAAEHMFNCASADTEVTPDFSDGGTERGDTPTPRTNELRTLYNLRGVTIPYLYADALAATERELAAANAENAKLREALVEVAFGMHSEPQYMCIKGLALIDNNRVEFRFADGRKVTATIAARRTEK